MSTLIRGWIDINKIPLEEFVEVKDKDGKPTGDRRYTFVMSIDDETKKPFYTNTSIYSDQSKEERDAKKKRFYTGNGRVVWTDGRIVAAEKKPYLDEKVDEEGSELPF